MAELSGLPAGRNLPEEIPLSSILLEAEGKWMGTEETGHLKIFEPGTPVLWCSVSTNCVTTRPVRTGTVHAQ